jgi:hypothetical protein
MAFPSSLSHKAMADPLIPTGTYDVQAADPVWLHELFNAFLREIVPTPQAYANSRLQAEDVVYTLRRALYPLRIAASVTGDSLIVGGVGKRTALAPISCVDVLYLLPTKLRISRTADALKVLHAALAHQYETDAIAASELGIEVLLPDRRVRVIPALGQGAGYKIPGPTTLARASGWRVTNPVAEAATLRLSDSLYGGATRRLLTLLKAWREASKVPVDSLTLEVLVQEFYATQPRPPALPDAFKAFVAWARSKQEGTLTAPGAHTQLELDKAWHGAAKAAFWRITLAEGTAKTDPLKTALEWRHLLGLHFPVPETHEADTDIPPIIQACA